MRCLLVLSLLLLANLLPGQLRVGGNAGAGMVPDARVAQLLPVMDDEPAFSTLFLYQKPGTRRPAYYGSVPAQLVPEPFDFTAAKPYLAFFCRLELDIEEATRFPVRFRLGEVRGWQQELSKRD